MALDYWVLPFLNVFVLGGKIEGTTTVKVSELNLGLPLSNIRVDYDGWMYGGGVTLAGGGNRAFYLLGLLNRWGERLLPRVAAAATCSAGACVLLMYLSERRPEARRLFRERTRGIERNLDWRRLVRGERLAPHGLPISRAQGLFASL